MYAILHQNEKYELIWLRCIDENGLLMLNRLCVIALVIFLTGCNIMPGMQNPDVSTMTQINSNTPPHKIHPVLIPITPRLLAQEHVGKYVYRIAPADVLNIIIWQHPEFTPRELSVTQLTGLPSTQGAAGKEGYLVNASGYIYFPLLGHVKVVGKTTDQLRSLLTKHLKKYLKHPELNVRVVDYRGRKVYIFGEIMKSGFVPITDQPLSITDAISLSGGLNPNSADPEHIYVIRGAIHRPIVYWLNARTPDGFLLAQHFILKPGDILYVSSAPAARWNRVINQLLPTIQTIWYTKSIIE